MAEPPFPSAEEALRCAYSTIAKKELGLRGTLADPGGGELSPAEQMAQAAMIINTVRDRIGDPFRCAIGGAMMVWVDWPSRNEKYAHLKALANWVTCPNNSYKMHCLAMWSGLHQPDDKRWSERIGVTTRTLYRWREGKESGVTRQADHFLKVGLNVATDVFIEVGIM